MQVNTRPLDARDVPTFRDRDRERSNPQAAAISARYGAARRLALSRPTTPTRKVARV